MKRLVFVLPLIGFAVLAGLFAWGLMRDTDKPAEGLIGKPAPASVLATLSGEGGITLSPPPSGAALVNFWATWCAPCEIEHPVFMRMAAAGTPIYGVLYKDVPETAKGVLAEQGDPYRAVALDPDGRFALEFGIAGVPETFLIGADGTILARHVGVVDDAVAAELMAALEAAGG